MKKAEEFSVKQKIELTDYLIKNNLITKDLLGQALAENFKVPYFDLNTYPPSANQVKKISQIMAEKYNVVLAKEEEKKNIFATDDPSQESLIIELKSIFKDKNVVLNYSLPEDIRASFLHYRQPLKTRCEQIIKSQTKVASSVVEEIMKEALSFNASDVHFEPLSEDFLIRFRIDGVLQDAGRLPMQYYNNVLNRIKIQSDLRIDEHQATQDGAIRYSDKEISVDIRVSIVPTINGEKIVLRLLSKHVTTLDLSFLGLSAEDQEKINKSAKKPFGMVLVTGTTGSGKTTTLYAILKILNQPEVNITTIEDPVEYRIETINQIQVNNDKNITFAKGLRSIVRQDPDIILVGEIRDLETAEIAVNAALTGHLLLSTFHANNVAATIPRLLDMGVEKFLLASTLELVVAQRLARKICDTCRHSVPVTKKDLIDLPEDMADDLSGVKNLYKGKGCPACNNTGYRGRVGIFEIMNITPEIRESILKDPSSMTILQIAKEQGLKTLFEDGLEKVKSGITSLEELKRVASASEY